MGLDNTKCTPNPIGEYTLEILAGFAVIDRQPAEDSEDVWEIKVKPVGDAEGHLTVRRKSNGELLVDRIYRLDEREPGSRARKLGLLRWEPTGKGRIP